MRLWLVFTGIITVVLCAPQIRRDSECGVSNSGVDLKPILDKYMALIDANEIKDFMRQKLVEQDPGLIKILMYWFGNDAKAITNFLWDQSAYVELIEWYYENGLTNIYNRINEMHRLFGWGPVGPPSVIELTLHNRKTRSVHSVGDFIEQFLQLVPLDQLMNLTLELLYSEDPPMITLYSRLRCPEVASFWSDLKNLNEFQNMLRLLREEGVDVDPIITIIESIFGWKRESKAHALYKFNLQSAWNQILAATDTEGLELFLKDTQYTPCGQTALNYIRGDQFDHLIKDFYAEKGFKTALNWMKSNGLPQIYDFIAEIHEQLGIDKPPYPKEYGEQCNDTQWATIREQLNVYIPQDKLADVFYELIKNDDSVQELLKLLASSHVETSYHHFRKQDSYKLFLAKVRGAGFEIDKFITLIEALMAWDNRPKILL